MLRPCYSTADALPFTLLLDAIPQQLNEAGVSWTQSEIFQG